MTKINNFANALKLKNYRKRDIIYYRVNYNNLSFNSLKSDNNTHPNIL